MIQNTSETTFVYPLNIPIYCKQSFYKKKHEARNTCSLLFSEAERHLRSSHFKPTRIPALTLRGVVGLTRFLSGWFRSLSIGQSRREHSRRSDGEDSAKSRIAHLLLLLTLCCRPPP